MNVIAHFGAADEICDRLDQYVGFDVAVLAINKYRMPFHLRRVSIARATAQGLLKDRYA